MKNPVVIATTSGFFTYFYLPINFVRQYFFLSKNRVVKVVQNDRDFLRSNVAELILNSGEINKKNMKLIVGLGNPGKKYEKTRHNVGFMALDKMALNFKFVKKFNAEIAIKCAAVPYHETAAEWGVRAGRCGDVAASTRAQSQTIFAKPQTFMNLSGQSVSAIMSFYKIAPEDLVVIHDDLDIELGEFKAQKNRSSAGHNGAQSIIDLLGTKDFTRIRIGIKNIKLETNLSAEKFVLEKFNKEEMGIINDVIKKVFNTL